MIVFAENTKNHDNETQPMMHTPKITQLATMLSILPLGLESHPQRPIRHKFSLNDFKHFILQWFNFY